MVVVKVSNGEQSTVKMVSHILVRFVALLALTPFIYAVELTFELPDSAEQCFYEEITRGIKSTIEYQVRFFFDFD